MSAAVWPRHSAPISSVGLAAILLMVGTGLGMHLISVPHISSSHIPTSSSTSCTGVGYQIPYDGVWLPNSNCTGWAPTGVSLTSYGGSCTLSSTTTIDSKTINCNPLNINSNNVTITRSQINGVVRFNSSTRTGVLIEDTLIDGQNAFGGSGGQCVGGNSGTEGGATETGVILNRVDIVGCEQGVYGRGFTLKYSYIHDLYLNGADHTEPVLIGTSSAVGGDVVLLGNNIRGNLRQDDGTSGGASSVVSAYTHSAFWNDLNNILVQGNRFETGYPGGEGGYCVYAGEAGPAQGVATNTVWQDNYFARGNSGTCGQFGDVIGISGSSGSCWQRNIYENNGTNIGGTSGPGC